jgi:hypothetical protein
MKSVGIYFSTKYSVIGNFAAANISSEGLFQYKIFSQREHCTRKYSVSRNISVPAAAGG